MLMLSLLSAALCTDLIVMGLLVGGVFSSKTLTLWYKKFGLGAVISDVLILVLVIVIASFLYPFLFSTYHIVLFSGLAVGLQWIHDLAFGFLVKNYKGTSEIMNVFHLYVKEHSASILFADSAMILSTIVLNQLFPDSMVLFLSLVYMVPYLVFSV